MSASEQPNITTITDGVEFLRPVRLGVGDTDIRTDGEGIRSWAVSGREIVRRLHLVVRDTGWRTVPLDLRSRTVTATEDRLVVEFVIDAAAAALDVGFRMRVDVTAHDLCARLDGEFRRGSEFNRIGLCVLLPPDEIGGGQISHGHDRGELTTATLPETISPQAHVDGLPCSIIPAFDRLVVGLRGGGRLDASFDGDLFELEDQRNWSDDSFKVYSTPLSLGLPHTVPAGSTLHQTIEVAFVPDETAAPGSRSPRAPLRLVLRVPEPAGVVPPIGTVATASSFDPASGQVSHLLHRPDGRTPARFSGASSETAAELPATDAALTAFRGGWPALNRSRPELHGGGILVPINATVHACDDESVRTTVRSHGRIARETASMYPHSPRHFGPIDFLAVPGEWSDATGDGLFPPVTGADPRRSSAFAAAWVVASVAEFLQGAPASLTYLDADALFPCGHGLAPSAAGAVIRMLAARAGSTAFTVSAPKDVACLAWPDAADGRPENWTFMIANNASDRLAVDTGTGSVIVAPHEVALIEGWHPR